VREPLQGELILADVDAAGVAAERFSLGWAALPLFDPLAAAPSVASPPRRGVRAAAAAEAAAWGGSSASGGGGDGAPPLLAAQVVAGTPRYLLFRQAAARSALSERWAATSDACGRLC
jgi:hypothetical protein